MSATVRPLRPASSPPCCPDCDHREEPPPPAPTKQRVTACEAHGVLACVVCMTDEAMPTKEQP